MSAIKFLTSLLLLLAASVAEAGPLAFTIFYPGPSGPVKSNGTYALQPETSSDIIGLWTGCSGVLVLQANGQCGAGGSPPPISIGKQLASSYTASIANPTTMTWAPIWQRREISPFANLANLPSKLQTSYDPMVQDIGAYSRFANINVWSFSNGLLSISSTADTSGSAQAVVAGGQGWSTPGLVVSAEHITETTDTSGFSALGVGINNSTANGNNVMYAYMEIGSGSNNRINIVDSVGGTFTTRASSANNSLPSGITGFAYELINTAVIVWIQVNGNSWYPSFTFSYTSLPFNLTTPSVMATFHPYLVINGGATTPWKIGGLRTGVPGYLNFRDWKIVSNYDGTPYVSNGYLYFTADDPAASVYRLNPTSGDLQKVGEIVFNYGGVSNWDQNAKIIWDPNLQLWRILWASWHVGLNNGVKLYYATYSGDILNGVKTVSGGAPIAVTQATNNAIYDEDVVWNGSTWLVSYIVSPGGTFGGNFYPVIDSTANFSTFTNIWAASGTTGYEGSAIAKIGGNFYVTAGNGSQFDVWNVSSATPLGTMNASPFPNPAGNPPPHFVVFPWMDNGITSYYALSWNNTQYQVGGVSQGTFAAGTLELYQAAQTETGFEFPYSLGIH